MIFANGRVVCLISPEPWHGNKVSKHHYAHALADAGCQVYFVNPPSGQESAVPRVEPVARNINVVNARPVQRGLRWWPTALRNRVERVWLERLESQIGRKFDVVWLFENSRFFDMRFAGKRMKIYHQVDLNQDFNVKAAAQTSDICFAVSDLILEKLRRYSSNAHKINHGWNHAQGGKESPVDGLERLRRDAVKAMCVGNLDIPYLDLSLICELVEQFPAVDFHLVGACSDVNPLRSQLAGRTNVVWWGRVDSSCIPTLLASADLLLVTYLAEQFRSQLANPHKMMEYLASGKTIVSTYTDEYKDKRSLLLMADAREDFVPLFYQAIPQLNALNSPEMMALRRDFAMENTYNKHLAKIQSLIESTVS